MTDTTDFDLASYRARIALTGAADLVEHVLIHRIPGRVVPDGQPSAPRASRTPGAPLNLTALDDADLLVTTLLDRALRWRTTLGIVDRPLIRAIRYAFQVPLGFRDETTPAGARESVAHITAWLLLHHDDIARHPDAFTYFGDVAALIEPVRSRFPADVRPPRPHWKRECPACGELGVTATWTPGADVRDVQVWCDECGFPLVSTSADGVVRPGGSLDTKTRAERDRDRELVRIVREIAVGTTVPRRENPEPVVEQVGRCRAVGVEMPSGGDEPRTWQCVRREGHAGAHQISRSVQPALTWSRAVLA